MKTPNIHIKIIPEYPDYSISSDGTVFSNKFNKTSALKPGLNNRGYPIVCLYKNNKKSYFSVHRLVAQVFLGKSKLQVDHINGIKTDNRVENLQYLSCFDNVRKSNQKAFFSFVKATNIVTHEVFIFHSVYAAAKQLHICRSKIRLCLLKKRNKTKNYKFEYLLDIDTMVVV